MSRRDGGGSQSAGQFTVKSWRHAPGKWSNGQNGDAVRPIPRVAGPESAGERVIGRLRPDLKVPGPSRWERYEFTII